MTTETASDAGTDSSGLPAWPMRRTCPFQAPEQYAEMRAQNPISRVVFPSGRIVWAVTSHALMRQVLSDPRFSANKAHPDFPNPSPGFAEGARLFEKSLIAMDGPEHAKHRRMIAAEFTAKRTKAMRPHVQRIVDSCVEQMLAGSRPVDLVAAFSLPVTTQMICELLGVPYADREFFHTVTHTLAYRGTTAERRVAAAVELVTYLDGVVTAAEREPGDDVLGRLIVKYREAGEYDHERLIHTAWTLLTAGHETTANMISLSTVTLLEHPDQLAAFRADPGLTGQAVEELLRLLSISDGGTGRLAMEDIEIGGVLIRKGEAVVTLAAAANHDPEAFDHPGELDIHRKVRGHLAFGHGVHNCVGQSLARLELEIALPTLFARIPGLKLAVPADTLRYKDDAQVYGLYELPVTW